MEFMLILYRLISRAVLVYFNEVCPHTSEERDDYDIMLDEAMELAPAAAGEIIALGKILIVKRDDSSGKSFRKFNQHYQRPYIMYSIHMAWQFLLP